MLTLKREHDDRYTSFDGRLYLERRPKLSPFWQVRTSFESRQMTRTTKCADLRSAAEWAEKWYLSLRYKLANGEPIENRHTLAFAFREFINHHEKLIETGESNAKKVKRYRDTWNNIKERLGNVAVDRITFDTLQQFKDWRVATAKKPTDPKKKPRTLTGKTLNADLSLVRLVLSYATNRGWLKNLPNFPTAPIKHVSPDWFTLEEYKTLIAASRARWEAMKDAHPHHYHERRELHAFILMMAHSCVRVDECLAVRWSDCIEPPENEKLKKLKQFRDCTVRLRIRDGKVGYREALGMHGAVWALEHLRALSPNAKPEDRLFTSGHSQAFENLLVATNLRRDLKGRLRNQKTLRHTSIMMRCLFNPHLSTAELSTIAGTSMVSLEKYYLRHLKAAHIQKRLIEGALAAQ